MKAKIVWICGSLALLACGQARASAEQDLLSQAWSPDLQSCKVEFVRFSGTEMTFKPRNRAQSSLKVLNIVNPTEQSETVMVVVDPGNVPARNGRPRDEDLGAFLFDVSGERLQLIAQGPPTNLLPVTPDRPNAKRFDLIRCPAT